MDDRISRRQAIQMGLGVAALSPATRIGRAAADNVTEIVTVVKNGNPWEREEVPTSWLEHFLQAKRVKEAVDADYADDPTVASIGLEKDTSRSFGGRDGFRIAMEVDSSGVLGTESLPESTDGIAIKKSPKQDRGLGSCTNAGEFDPVPGGVWVEDKNYGGRGTTCCRVTVDSKEYMLTARHLFPDPCDSLDSREAVQSVNWQEFGTTADDGQADDWVLIDPQDSEGTLGLSSKIADQNNWDASGHMTEEGIANAIGENVEALGTTTGRTSGPISKMNVTDTWTGDDGDEYQWSSCVDFSGHGVEFDLVNAEGDSGGPIYQPNDRFEVNIMTAMYQMWIGNEGTADYCSDSAIESHTARGIAAYHLHNSEGMSFG